MKMTVEIVPCPVTTDMNSVLDRPFIVKEIKQVIFSMGGTKASGPDGFQAMFYQKNWALLSDQVTYLCLNILNRDLRMEKVNMTFIVLILKVNNAKKVTDF